jgi:hypothetical protein
MWIPSMCGAQDIIYSNSSHYFLLKCVVGQGNNNGAEFNPLCLIMKTIVEKVLKQLWAYEESMILKG